MSKNIYKVDSRKNLDLIIEKNYLKPICVVFIKESDNKEEYILTQESLKALAKECSYCIILLVNFDKFTDYNDFFKDIKNATPYFITFFKNLPITTIEKKEKFLESVIDRVSAVNQNYIEKLFEAFNNQQTNDNNQQTTISNNQPQTISNNNQSETISNNNQPQTITNNNQQQTIANNNNNQQPIINDNLDETSNLDDNYSEGHIDKKNNAIAMLLQEINGLDNI